MADCKRLLLDRDDSVLVVVDIQHRLTAVMPEDAAQTMLANVGKLLSAASLLEIPTLVTEQYPQGLGPTEASILDKFGEDVPRLAKTGFSCCSAQGFNERLAAGARKQIILLGQETHVCVLQTAMELLGQGYHLFVVEDAVCSRLASDKRQALSRMRDGGVTLVCHESVLFEWLRDATHPHFKTISSWLR